MLNDEQREKERISDHKDPRVQKNGKGNHSGLEATVMVSQLGLAVAIPIVLGALAGRWLDGKFGTGMIFFLILLCLGIAGGLTGAYHQITAIVRGKK